MSFTMSALATTVAEIQAMDIPIAIKPTQLILPGPTRQWMHKNGVTRQDIVDMVAAAYVEAGIKKEGDK